MKFVVTWKAFETITQEQARHIRAGMGQGLEQMLGSPNIQDAGFFADSRGMYLILDDIDSADEILEILGPEILDNGYVESHPITTPQRIGELFGQWVEQGR